MVFSSHLFCFYFLPLALLVYYASPRRLRHLALTLLSYLFYGWANPAFVVLMFFSTAVDYLCGLVVARARLFDRGEPEVLAVGEERSRRQRWAVTVSVVTNLSLLGFFKYFNLAVDSYHGLIAWAGLPLAPAEDILRVTLPLGISFYTFQSMSYTIDVYRGRTAALRDPIDFACYVSMFPQLVAGPIVRFSEIADQLRSRTHTLEKMGRGFACFALGMAKKVLIANPCGKVADLTFGSASLETPDAWFGVLAYSFQIYFDFSGYSDMAIGLGLMLGFVFPENFDSPYRSRSITEFWRRWHMSLSRWLKDYLYIPLGGNRRGRGRTYLNLMIVMLLGGLWHGAAWTFVVWGCLHGLFLAAERWSRERGSDGSQGVGGTHGRTLGDGLRVARTFLLVLLTWVFFRAESFNHALDYLGAMVALGDPLPQAALLGGVIYRPYYLLTLVLAMVVTWLGRPTWEWSESLTPAKAVVSFVALAAALLAMETQGYNPFIYFIF